MEPDFPFTLLLLLFQRDSGIMMFLLLLYYMSLALGLQFAVQKVRWGCIYGGYVTCAYKALDLFQIIAKMNLGHCFLKMYPEVKNNAQS